MCIRDSSGISSAPAQIQRASLFSHLTLAMQDVVTYQLDIDPATTTLRVEQILEALRIHVRSQRSVLLDRIAFAKRVQAVGEGIDSYVADLRRLWAVAELCHTCKEDTLRTQMLFGINNDAARKAVLKMESTPSLQECIRIIRAEERAVVDSLSLIHI